MTIVGALPFTLQNGTIADATQVMADFGAIKTDVNANAAANGANNDITSLSGLTTPLSVAQGGTGYTTNPLVFPYGQLYALELSNTGGGTTAINITGGACRDSTNFVTMLRSVSLTGKVLANAWTVGNSGGLLDTGAVANDTYHIYLIERLDTHVVDAIASLSPSAPTLPANYTVYRRLGSILREAGAIVLFSQNEDTFLRKAISVDVAAGNPGTSAFTNPLKVPTGIVVDALINAVLTNTGVGGVPYAYISSLAVDDEVPTAGLAQMGSVAAALGRTQQALAGTFPVRTDTSAQIRMRLSYSDADVSLVIGTAGWVDTRGRLGP